MATYHVDLPDDWALVRLLSRRHVVEILDALREHPRSWQALQHATHGRGRHLRSALRALAAHRLVTRLPKSGTWDLREEMPSHRYVLTTAGQELSQRLMRIDVWANLYRVSQDGSIE